MKKPEDDLITRNDIKVKVFYSFQGSTTICLCSYRTTLAHSRYQTIVDIPLRPCLQILCTSSPDILLQSDKDCAVYSAHLHSSKKGSSTNGTDFVWEGHGLLSWILEEQFHADHLINGRLYQHHIEVQLELHQTQKMTKSAYYHELTKSTLDPSHNIKQQPINHHSHTHTPSASPLSSYSIPGHSSLHDDSDKEDEKQDTQLPPLHFHAISSTKLPDSPRKRIRLMSENSTCPAPDPISANDNNNNNFTHWSKPPRTITTSILYRQHSISLPPPPPGASTTTQSRPSQPSSLSSSSPSSLSSLSSSSAPPPATTSIMVTAPPMRSSSSSLSIFTTTITTNGRRKKRDTKPPNTSDVRTFTKVDQDKNGNYCLPVEIDSWTVYSLGYVVYDRPAFHNQRYIYPVGYKVKKWYRSMIDPKSDTQYICEILDGGQEPIFRLEADDNPGKSYTGPTPTTVWTIAVREAFAIRNMDYGHNPVGPDFFGLRKNAIAKMIQDLPNADKCDNYIWQKFMVGSTSKSSKGRTLK